MLVPIVAKLSGEQAMQFHGVTRIVRNGAGNLIGVAVMSHDPTVIWLHGDQRQAMRILPRTGKVVGQPWFATPAQDSEVAETLNSI